MTGTEFEQRQAVGDRDLIFELMAGDPALGSLDRETGARLVDHPHPDARPPLARQIALPDVARAPHWSRQPLPTTRNLRSISVAIAAPQLKRRSSQSRALRYSPMTGTNQGLPS